MPGQSDVTLGNLRNTVVIATAITAAACNANTTNQQTFTVLGLLPGDQISAVTKATFQAGLFIAYADVSAKDTLRITFANITAGSITPTSGDLYTIEINRPTNLGLTLPTTFT
jgi:hypothetical protein